MAQEPENIDLFRSSAPAGVENVTSSGSEALESVGGPGQGPPVLWTPSGRAGHGLAVGDGEERR